jgi:hypothetical protein
MSILVRQPSAWFASGCFVLDQMRMPVGLARAT